MQMLLETFPRRLGHFLSCHAFGKIMAEQGYGRILNVSSMSIIRRLTRIPAYSAAKTAVSNFMRWLTLAEGPRQPLVALAVFGVRDRNSHTDGWRFCRI
jgi:NAD(P)-dependent dehydrogenase (short-subunit alcohol dehydrogenase family)